MKLIVDSSRCSHVSFDTVAEFESAILADPLVEVARPSGRFLAEGQCLLQRVVRKLGYSIVPDIDPERASNPMNDPRHLFAVLMRLDAIPFGDYGLALSGNRSAFLFDAWPDRHDLIVAFAEEYKINHLFVSASQAADALRARLPKTHVHWIPEGINPDEYHFDPPEEKSIDVLALGRKYDAYHQAIVGHCEERQRQYRYEKVKGQLVFDSRSEFIDGLARSKIVVCVPSSVTHPERSGAIETMTIRYLQAMASKCLVLGHMPAEMGELFDDQPVIEIDMQQPTLQLDSILDHFADYLPLIERNYQAVRQHHSWSHRWEQIKKTYQNATPA